MKTSVKKDAHTGEQPIRVLKHNLTTRFVERNEAYIKTLHSDRRLDNRIKYHIADLPLISKQTPYIEETGIINIHESFLSYVWCLCYYFFVLHEEGVAIPDSINRNLPVHKTPNPELINEAKELFDYAKYLIRFFDLWDKENLPNPEYYDESTTQGWYILRTNDLFVEAINFILYHESAHAEFEHIKKIKSEKLSGAAIKSLEIDADTRAIELILSNGRNRHVSELGIIIGIASMLFFNDSLDGGPKHPDIDKRLENAIILFNPKEDNPVWTMLALFIKVWNEQFGLGLTNELAYNSFKDLYYDLLSQAK